MTEEVTFGRKQNPLVELEMPADFKWIQIINASSLYALGSKRLISAVLVTKVDFDNVDMESVTYLD